MDADSEGLLILTNDSDLSVRLTAPEHAVPKTYRVTVTGRPTDETLRRLRDGVELADGPTRPARVRLLNGGDRTSVLEVVLTEGRNRQIRRMAAAVGHKVRRLVRVAIGGLHLEDLHRHDACVGRGGLSAPLGKRMTTVGAMETKAMSDLKARVVRVVAEEVAPALQMDGTAIEVLDVSDGVVQVRINGACGNCPGSIYAVVMGIEEELRRRVPEVQYLEAVP